MYNYNACMIVGSYVSFIVYNYNSWMMVGSSAFFTVYIIIIIV